MGPKTRGFRKNKGGDSKNRFVWEDYIPEPPESDTNADVINLGLSPEEEAKKLFENDTRRRTRRIIEAVRHHRRKQRTIKEQQSTIGLSVSDDEFTKRRTELINASKSILQMTWSSNCSALIRLPKLIFISQPMRTPTTKITLLRKHSAHVLMRYGHTSCRNAGNWRWTLCISRWQNTFFMHTLKLRVVSQ